MDFNCLFDIVSYQRHRFPQAVAVAGRRQGGDWRRWSVAELEDASRKLAAALYDQGLRPGDFAGILAHCGSPEWLLADLALQRLGVIVAPIHATARPDEVAFILRDSGMKLCFISNADMLAHLRRSSAALPRLAAFEPLSELPDLASWLEQPVSAEATRFVEELGADPDAPATVLYTSGTTGLPKGVLLSHRNIVSNVKSVLAIVPIDQSYVAVSFLPLSHIFERMVLYVYLAAGVSIWYVESPEELPATLREVRPHIFTAVPRVLERSYDRLLARRAALGKAGRWIFDWAVRLGCRYPYTGGGTVPFVYRLKQRVADALIFRHWRKALGGRLQVIVVGAAALQPRLGRLFNAAGIRVREGYGLTETSPVVAFNRFEPGGVHFGTVGIPAPGVDVRIAHPDENGEGEIEVRGPNVMLGYLHNPEETAAKFTPDGWLRTGDTGRFEHKRFLKITGRISEIFKTSSGKFVAPAYVESQLQQSPFIQQALVVGLNQPHVGAILSPNFDALETWCQEHKVHWTAPEFMIFNPKVQQLFEKEIEAINREHLEPVERVRVFRLTADAWTAENGLLTPTLKLRRKDLTKQYEHVLEEMFG
jgi:long-chain acyl-CoA synthetase